MTSSSGSVNGHGRPSGLDVTGEPDGKRRRLTSHEQTWIWVNTGRPGTPGEDQWEPAEEEAQDTGAGDPLDDPLGDPRGMPGTGAREDPNASVGGEGEKEAAGDRDAGPSGGPAHMDPGLHGPMLPDEQGSPGTDADNAPAGLVEASIQSGHNGSGTDTMPGASSDSSGSVVFVGSSSSSGDNDSGLGGE